MWGGNVRFGELLIEDSTYLGDQKRLPWGSDVWVEPSREKRGKLESSSKATSWCEAQTEIWNVRRVPAGDEEDHWVWEPCGVCDPSWKPGGATGGYYASEVWDLVTEGPAVSSPTPLGDGSCRPPGEAHSSEDVTHCALPGAGSQGSMPVPEALSLAGILPFPRGDHSHAGWDHQQPQGVESACRWVRGQDEGAGGGEAETAGSQPSSRRKSARRKATWGWACIQVLLCPIAERGPRAQAGPTLHEREDPGLWETTLHLLEKSELWGLKTEREFSLHLS